MPRKMPQDLKELRAQVREITDREKSRINEAVFEAVSKGRSITRVDATKGQFRYYLDAVEEVLNDDSRVRIHASYTYPDRYLGSDGGFFFKINWPE